MRKQLSFAVLAMVLCVATASKVEWTLNGVRSVGQLSVTGAGYKPCDPAVKQYSGYFDIDSATDKHYFFWGFESRGNPYVDPVILWMTGGPGCSSGLAVMKENGPCSMSVGGVLSHNPYSWNNGATVIYIDQPAGVGFSYANRSGYDHNEAEVSEDMYRFMQAFYTAYPQFLKVPLFVVGESYGGHYAPATAYRIWQGNQRNEGAHINLRGLAVGNGLTTPEVQYEYYAPFAWDWCRKIKGTPCVTKQGHDEMVAGLPQCISLIKQCNAGNGNAAACKEAQDNCGDSQMNPYMESGLNPYDIRIPCEVPGLCYNFSSVTEFFNEAAVQTSLGVRPTKWESCNYEVNGDFSADWMRNFNYTVPTLLANNIRVMIYAGDLDFIVNFMGCKAWTLALDWPQKTAFNAAGDKPWYADNKEVGLYRTVGNLHTKALFSFVQVHEAGHMVPMDQPKVAWNMMQHFLADQPFA